MVPSNPERNTLAQRAAELHVSTTTLGLYRSHCHFPTHLFRSTRSLVTAARSHRQLALGTSHRRSFASEIPRGVLFRQSRGRTQQHHHPCCCLLRRYGPFSCNCVGKAREQAYLASAFEWFTALPPEIAVLVHRSLCSQGVAKPGLRGGDERAIPRFPPSEKFGCSGPNRQAAPFSASTAAG